jgi:hypothetical protein
MAHPPTITVGQGMFIVEMDDGASIRKLAMTPHMATRWFNGFANAIETFSVQHGVTLQVTRTAVEARRGNR